MFARYRFSHLVKSVSLSLRKAHTGGLGQYVLRERGGLPQSRVSKTERGNFQQPRRAHPSAGLEIRLFFGQLCQQWMGSSQALVGSSALWPSDVLWLKMRMCEVSALVLVGTDMALRKCGMWLFSRRWLF